MVNSEVHRTGEKFESLSADCYLKFYLVSWVSRLPHPLKLRLRSFSWLPYFNSISRAFLGQYSPNHSGHSIRDTPLI